MIAQDVAAMADEFLRAGFSIVIRSISAVDGRTQYRLSGRGSPGAFCVLAPTEAEAFRRGIEHVRDNMTPDRSGWYASG